MSDNTCWGFGAQRSDLTKDLIRQGLTPATPEDVETLAAMPDEQIGMLLHVAVPLALPGDAALARAVVAEAAKRLQKVA